MRTLLLNQRKKMRVTLKSKRKSRMSPPKDLRKKKLKMNLTLLRNSQRKLNHLSLYQLRK